MSGVAASWMAAALLLAGPALAAPRERPVDRLSDTEVTVRVTTERIEELERQVAPGRGFITEQQAMERFEEAVYLHLIGEYEAAAEQFFTLVTTASLTDAGYHRDAEWYLAESLFMMGNITTAEARYLVIADDDQHPFRDEAVRRLLELYATTGQTEEFKAYYEQEILNGRVRPSDVITYSLAKSFYFQGDVPKALEHFGQLAPTSPYYAKSRYFLGAIAVDQGDLDKAIPYFQEVLALPSTALDRNTIEGREIYDLSLLALGRIHFERDELAEAVDYYGQIDTTSEYYADQLYESIWTYIKQARKETDDAKRLAEFQGALDGVEIFLLRFPEHEYTAQLQLLEAHLRMEQKQWDTALTSYEQVVADYTPIKEKFARLAKADSEPKEYFQQILGEADGKGPPDDGGEALPAYAVAMMLSDESLSRALTIYRELEDQESQIGQSEELISELRTVLDSAAGIGGFERLRYEIAVNQGSSTDSWLELLSIEEQWIEENGSVESKREVEALIPQRERLVAKVEAMGDDFGNDLAREARRQHLKDLASLESQVEGLAGDAEALRARLDTPDSGASLSPAEERRVREELSGVETDLESVRTRLEELRMQGPSLAWEATQEAEEAGVAADVEALRREYRKLRPSVSASGKEEFLARLDGTYTTVESDLTRLSTLRSRLGEMESSEVGRIRDRFEHEVKEVASQRVELDHTLTEAEDVSLALTRAGFGRLEDFFAESVLKADMGIVDVYWAEKVDVADQRKRMAEEKAALLEDLDARFSLIRQKLGQ